MSRRTIAVLGTALLATALAGSPRAGGEAPLDKYQSLIQEKRSLLREAQVLKQEVTMAATRNPYLLFDAKSGKLEFRVRGKTLKTYSFTAVTMDERGRRPADPEAVWTALQGALTVMEKQGGQPELIPPDPETGREAGLLYSDPNQLAEETGVKPVDTDAGVLGVDVPTDYYIRFEESVVFHIRTPKSLSFRQKAADRLGEIARSMRATWTSLWGGELAGDAQPRLALWLTTDTDTAKNLHYSLLPGEKLYLVPPPPPPILLVASTRDSAPSRGSL